MKPGSSKVAAGAVEAQLVEHVVDVGDHVVAVVLVRPDRPQVHLGVGRRQIVGPIEQPAIGGVLPDIAAGQRQFPRIEAPRVDRIGRNLVRWRFRKLLAFQVLGPRSWPLQPDVFAPGNTAPGSTVSSKQAPGSFTSAFRCAYCALSMQGVDRLPVPLPARSP